MKETDIQAWIDTIGTKRHKHIDHKLIKALQWPQADKLESLFVIDSVLTLRKCDVCIARYRKHQSGVLRPEFA